MALISNVSHGGIDDVNLDGQKHEGLGLEHELLHVFPSAASVPHVWALQRICLYSPTHKSTPRGRI